MKYLKDLAVRWQMRTQKTLWGQETFSHLVRGRGQRSMSGENPPAAQAASPRRNRAALAVLCCLQCHAVLEPPQQFFKMFFGEIKERSKCSVSVLTGDREGNSC